jgi:retron-type reverse transcriptase
VRGAGRALKCEGPSLPRQTDFLGFSYGFRPGRSPHHALDALATGITKRKVNWVLDADIRGFYDAIDHGWMLKFLEHRIADKRVLRLIRKWLKAGVIEDGAWSETLEGTAQGASVSSCSQTSISTTCSTCGPTSGGGGTRTVM